MMGSQKAHQYRIWCNDESDHELIGDEEALMERIERGEIGPCSMLLVQTSEDGARLKIAGLFREHWKECQWQTDEKSFDDIEAAFDEGKIKQGMEIYWEEKPFGAAQIISDVRAAEIEKTRILKNRKRKSQGPIIQPPPIASTQRDRPAGNASDVGDRQAETGVSVAEERMQVPENRRQVSPPIPTQEEADSAEDSEADASDPDKTQSLPIPEAETDVETAKEKTPKPKYLKKPPPASQRTKADKKVGLEGDLEAISAIQAKTGGKSRMRASRHWAGWYRIAAIVASIAVGAGIVLALILQGEDIRAMKDTLQGVRWGVAGLQQDERQPQQKVPPAKAGDKQNGQKTQNTEKSGKDTDATKPKGNRSPDGLDPQLEGLQKGLERLQKDAEENVEREVFQINSLKNETLQALKKGLESVEEQQKAQTDSVAKRISQLERGLGQVDGRIERLAASLKVPPDGELPRSLLMVDTGERMNQDNFTALEKAILRVVENAVRYTPKREIGLFYNRGDRIKTILPLERHFLVPDLEDLRKNLGKNRPTVGEDSDWMTGFQSIVDLAAVRKGRHRLVYVACNPVRRREVPTQKWEEIPALMKKYGVEVWIIQLLIRPDDPSSTELVQLAARTGGQYVALPWSLDSSSSSRKHLVSVLCQSLEIPNSPSD